MNAKIFIVGLGADGLAGVTQRAREVVQQTEMLYGSDSVLRLVPEIQAERIRIGGDLNEIVDKLRANLGKKSQTVIATGDPLFYGVARYLCDKIGQDIFEIYSHLSSMQLAFARIKESWEEAFISDLSTKTLDDVLDRIRTSETVGLFTTETYSPGRVARELLLRGIDYFKVTVCENLGGRDERITSGELSEIQSLPFDPLNVMILKRKPGRPDAPRAGKRLMRFGNPDDVFAQSRPKSGLITQAEVRAIALSWLDLLPGTIMWDVGAGSGSVALEAAQLVEPGRVFAIEQDSADYHLIVANAEMFGIRNVQAVFGSAPSVFSGLAKPDAIFIGGNGGEIARLLESSYDQLNPGGRLVVNVATLEMLHATYETMKRIAPQVQVTMMNLARSVEQMEALRFEAVNPTFLLKVQKPA